MISKLASALALTLALNAAACGADSPQRQPVDPELTPETEARIARLVRDLGSESYDVRSAARKALAEIGRPALGAIRAACDSKDLEVAESAKTLVEAIESGTAGSTVKVKRSGSRATGDLEISIITLSETVTVREVHGGCSVGIKKTGGAMALYSAPDWDKFAEKNPDIWAQYAAPALDSSDPDRMVKLAMLRELMTQARRQFVKAKEREPLPEESAEIEKQIRLKLDELFKKPVAAPGASSTLRDSADQSARDAAGPGAADSPRRRGLEMPTLVPAEPE